MSVLPLKLLEGHGLPLNRQGMLCVIASHLLLSGTIASLRGEARAAVGGRYVAEDLDGNRHTIPDPMDKAIVLVFIATDCLVSNSYVPEINRIYEKYVPDNIPMFVVYVDHSVPREAMQKHRREFGLKPPALADESHALARGVGATITPEAAVLTPSGKLLYRGRIDDTYVALGKRRHQPTQRDLRGSLDAVLSGWPVLNRTTQAVGCFICFGR
jgi:AhpC/TSA family protein